MRLGKKALYAILFGLLLISVQALIEIRYHQTKYAVPPELERLVNIHPPQWTPIVTHVTSPAWNSTAEKEYDKVAAQSYLDEYGNKITVVMTWSRNGIQRAGHIQQLCYTTQGFSISKPRDIEVSFPSRTLSVTVFEASRLGGEVDDVLYWRVTGGKVMENIMENKFNNYRLSHRILKIKEVINHLTGKIPDNVMVRISSVRSHKERPSAVPLQYLQEYVPLLSLSDRKLLLGE